MMDLVFFRGKEYGMGHRKFSWALGVTGIFMFSCSQEDSTAIKLKGANGQNQIVKDETSGHGPVASSDDATVTQSQDPATVSPKTTPPPAVLPPVVPPNPATEQAANVAMLTAGRVVTQVNITNPVAWGTSAAAPIEIKVPVTAAGALIVPATLPGDQQVPGVKDNLAGDTPFAGVTTLHGELKVCNDSTRAIQLHSGGGGPFKHGDTGIAVGTCQIMLVNNLAANPGGTYDHMQGAGAGAVLFKFKKILPDGSVMP